MNGWHDRKEIGERHEQHVMAQLRRRGWQVHPFGQGTFPAAIQTALCTVDSAVRYLPDMIAARGPDVVMIDAKTSLQGSGRYSVSVKCVTAGVHFTSVHAPVPLYFVFGDLTVLTPDEVMHYRRHSTLHRSGAYYVVTTSHAHPFDHVFGAAAEGGSQRRPQPPQDWPSAS